MTDWQRTLDLRLEYGQAQDGNLAIPELAGVVASRLERIRDFGDDYIDREREEICEEFELLSQDETAETAEFDWLMNRLWDWADQRLGGSGANTAKVCWVKT